MTEFSYTHTHTPHNFFIHSFSNGWLHCFYVLAVVSVCISSEIHNVERLFVRWFAIDISSLVECLYIFCPLFLTAEFCALILDSTYKAYHMISVFLSDLLHLVWRSLGPSRLLQRALFLSFFLNPWVVYALVLRTVSSSFIPLSENVNVVPSLGYCEQCCSEHRGACISLN